MAQNVTSKEMDRVVNLVRTFIRDFPELNRLTDGAENSPRMIMWAVIDALDDFNTTPPLIGTYDIKSHPSIHLLVRGATITLLESVSFLHARNQISYSDGGISVGKWDKAGIYMNMLQMMKATYEEKKQRLKVALNIKGAWGGAVASEYAAINGWYGSF